MKDLLIFAQSCPYVYMYIDSSIPYLQHGNHFVRMPSTRSASIPFSEMHCPFPDKQ